MWRWILFWLLCPLGTLFLVANWHGLLSWMFQRKRSSAIPILGGALLALGLATAPSPAVRPLWWLPLVLDPGCLLLLVSSVLFHARGSNR